MTALLWILILVLYLLTKSPIPLLHCLPLQNLLHLAEMLSYIQRMVP